jgi:hypothetical protein
MKETTTSLFMTSASLPPPAIVAQASSLRINDRYRSRKLEACATMPATRKSLPAFPVSATLQPVMMESDER